MKITELDAHQLTRIGKYPAPNLKGYSSLFFHHLTQGSDTSVLFNWGRELTSICENENIDIYYFNNDFGTKINVYPNEVIEKWWNNK